MKALIHSLIVSGSLVLPFLITGCGSFGLYSKNQVEDVAGEYGERGFEAGRAHEIRILEHERQRALEEKQLKEQYYRVPVPAHVNEEGIKIDEHFVPIKIITE